MELEKLLKETIANFDSEKYKKLAGKQRQYVRENKEKLLKQASELELENYEKQQASKSVLVMSKGKIPFYYSHTDEFQIGQYRKYFALSKSGKNKSKLHFSDNINFRQVSLKSANYTYEVEEAQQQLNCTAKRK